MSQIFDKTPLAKALFRGNDLSGARFDQGWLKGVTFSHCNLSGVSIQRSDIGGMTVDGVRIDILLETELDRLDKRRILVRIGNAYEVAEVRRAVGELEKVREQFCQRPRVAQAGHRTALAGDWKWSALQHCRHLVFAEELYTDRWIQRNKQPFSRLGLLPDWLEGKPGYEAVGAKPTEDLEAIISAWERVHARTRQVLETLTEDVLRTSTKGLDFGQGDVAGVFRALTCHDMHHIRAAEGVLAEMSGVQMGTANARDSW